MWHQRESKTKSSPSEKEQDQFGLLCCASVSMWEAREEKKKRGFLMG